MSLSTLRVVNAPIETGHLTSHPLPALPTEIELEQETHSTRRTAHQIFSSSAQSLNQIFEDIPPQVPVHLPHLESSHSRVTYYDPNEDYSNPFADMSHINGVNGAGLALPGMNPGIPTPAGHQHDLNHINTLLDEYSKMMEENRKLTARVMDSVGRVRERAGDRELTGNDVVDSSSKELIDTTKTLEGELSYMRKQLEETQNDSDDYAAIAHAYAKAMGEWIERIHAFKLKNTEDVSAWHRSYRDQLAHERAENLRLSNQILRMNEAAYSANESLKKFKENWDGNPRYYEEMTEKVKYRLLARTWKRMALRELSDDDSEFSDDDDLIDPAEKRRLAEEEQAKVRRRKAAQREAQETQDEVDSLSVDMSDVAL